MRLFFLPAILLLTFPVAGNSQELRIGVVNSELLVQSYPQFKEAEAQLSREMETLQSERKSWEASMERLQTTIKDLESQLRAGENSFSEKKKSELQAEIDSLQADFQQRLNKQMAYEQERIERRRSELIMDVLEIVNQEIEELGDQSNYDLIIDSSNGTVVYAKDPDDLTDQLLRNLQEK